jgi:hypothetical protein
MRAKFGLILLSFVIIAFTACEFKKQHINRDKDKEEAEYIIDSFYEYLKSGNYAAAFSYVHPSIWRVNDSVKLSEFFLSLNNLSGGLKSRKLDHWETKRVVGYEQSVNYKMYYVNKYDNLELKTSIILQQDLLDGRIKIVGFQANPDKFQ